MNTKTKIKDQAKLLFNSDGTPVITTRHIASALDMSQGNLHYHFPNKDNLIMAMYDDFIAGLIKREQFDQINPLSVNELIESTTSNFEWMYEYRFLFVDRDYIWHRMPLIADHFKEFIISKKAQISQLITLYLENDILKSPLLPKQRQVLLDQFELLITSWTCYIPFREDIPTERLPKYFAQLIFRTWIPYLQTEHATSWMESSNLFD